jgi:hypothetical protein
MESSKLPALGGTMSERAETIDARNSESRLPVRAASHSSEPARSSSADLQPPPSSAPSSGAYLPPPPAQLVAALAEFETSGPESFRRSVPEFTAADAPIGVPDPKAKVSTVQDDGTKAAPVPVTAPAINAKIAGAVAGVAVVIMALWALFSR